MNVLTALAKRLKCLVLVVDHFGKAAETGTRGGSAKEGSADAVLAILADRDLSGNVSNPRMAVRKMRGAPTGSEIPFAANVVDVGPDDNGNAQTTLVIEWKSEGAAFKKSEADPWPKFLAVFRDVLFSVLAEHGKDCKPFPEDPLLVRAVTDEQLRAEFYLRYPADGGTHEKRQEARRKAYNRSIIKAQERKLIGVANIEQATFIWGGTPGTPGARHVSRQVPPMCPADTRTPGTYPGEMSGVSRLSGFMGAEPEYRTDDRPVLGPPNDSLADFDRGFR